MAAGWSVMDALNKNSKAAAEDKPKARFRTRDISIKKMYSNDRNFYSMPDIEKLAGQILAVGVLENLTVAYEPCEKGEYKIIAGERRWRALSLLVEQGYSEFEIATCQIKMPAEEHEETVQIIMANAYRDKTVMDILEEERRLKESLQYMKDNGLKLQGYELDSGRLRDVIAQIMNTTATKIAQIESINKRLIPEFSEELKGGRLTFSAAYEISGMSEEVQKEMLERYRENGLTWKEVREAKKAAEEARAAQDTEERISLPKSGEYDWQQEDEADGEEESDQEDEGDDGEEQDRLDRETAKKLREREQEEAMQNLPSDGRKKRVMRVSWDMYKNITSGQVPYMIVKQEKEPYREEDILTLLAFKGGRATGDEARVCVTCADDSETSSAIVEGYAVIGVMDVYDAESMGLVELGDEE